MSEPVRARAGEGYAVSLDLSFDVVGADVIASPHQRRLYRMWERLRGANPLPLWRDLSLDEIAPFVDDLSFLDVIGAPGARRYQVIFHGRRIGEAYGSQCKGRFLDEIVPAARVAETREVYGRVVDAARAAYTVIDSHDRNGRPVSYRRLLLPFARDEDSARVARVERVARILASFELTGPAGAIDPDRVLISDEAQIVALRAVIGE